jgi:hypothetical protein
MFLVRHKITSCFIGKLESIFFNYANLFIFCMVILDFNCISCWTFVYCI